MGTLFNINLTNNTMDLTQSEKALILESLTKSKTRSEALIEESREWVKMSRGPFTVSYNYMYTEHWATIERLTIKVRDIQNIINKL